MNLSFIDWVIVIIVLGGMIYSVSMTKGLMKSVSDFLSAGRTAGRYVISISSGVAGLGAISIVMFLEMGYVAGFSLSWWGLSQGIILLAITMSGWVIYRFRMTRSLTLAQFFEKRYSRKFRIFAGMVAFFAGLINFGIFPAVGAQFFINFCGLPDSILGIPMYPLVMIVLLEPQIITFSKFSVPVKLPPSLDRYTSETLPVIASVPPYPSLAIPSSKFIVTASGSKKKASFIFIPE